MSEPLCLCAGCNAWEVVDGASVLGRTAPEGEEGTRLEKASVKICLLCIRCILPTDGQKVIDFYIKLDPETNYCIVLLCGLNQSQSIECWPWKSLGWRKN